VVFDPKAGKTIQAATQKSIIDYNVFEGVEVKGLARYTLSRGEVVWGDGSNLPRAGRGKFVRREPFHAVSKSLSVWKDLTAPRKISRSAEHMPIGV
jgi:dihydropyrimidinase